MKWMLLVLCHLSCLKSAYAQERTIGDSIKVAFSKNNSNAVITNALDLIYFIKYTNVTARPVSVYSELIFGLSPTRFANFDLPLYRRQYDTFARVDKYASSSGVGYLRFSLGIEHGYAAADSILRVFDMKREIIGPGKSITLPVNVLDNYGSIERGEYKFKIKLRINSKIVRGSQGPVIDHIDYIESDWFYFKVPHLLISSNTDFINLDSVVRHTDSFL